MTDRWFKIVGIERMQHYRDRNPPWVKLHTELLDSYAFGSLPDATKAHAMGLILLAARNGNKLPWDSCWIGQRLQATAPVDLNALLAAGWIELIDDTAEHASNPLATCKQPASESLASRVPAHSREGEAEREREGEQSRAESTPPARARGDDDDAAAEPASDTPVDSAASNGAIPYSQLQALWNVTVAEDVHASPVACPNRCGERRREHIAARFKVPEPEGGVIGFMAVFTALSNDEHWKKHARVADTAANWANFDAALRPEKWSRRVDRGLELLREVKDQACECLKRAGFTDDKIQEVMTWA